MYYSLTQQLISRDLMMYALNAAGHSQSSHQLICHPYVIKDVNDEEFTGFLHQDNN